MRKERHTASPSPSFSTCGDDLTYQGYDYATVEIGSQCWFAENLQSTKYNDEATIPTGLSNTEWISTTEGAVAVYADSESEVSYAGRLYNWYAVNTGKLCPAGWHVPENAEWTALTDALGGTTTAGAAMKSSATDSPSWNGSNSSGFSAVPGGLRASGNGDYVGGGGNTNFWTASTGTAAGKAYIRSMQDNGDGIYTFERNYPSGFSVRCIQSTH
jgi:uncharacterized protein (TIGR02145 family)